jgi:hypothetical protein
MKSLVVAGALGFACSSHAGLNLNLDQYLWFVLPANSVTITGTVQLEPGWHVTVGSVEFPGNGTDFLPVSFDPAFLAFVAAAVPGTDYTGNLFIVDAPAAATPGLYWLNNGPAGISPLSEFILEASNGSVTTKDTEVYAVQVVPEPATLAILGGGVLALIARRRKQA